MIKRARNCISFIVFVVLLTACTVDNEPNEETKDDKGATDKPVELAYNPPSMDDLDPDDPMTPYIKYGEEIFNETNVVLPDNVGNELSCQSCHADGGLSQSSSMVGVTSQFPQYRPREGVVFTLEDRINGCMVRSMNGEMIAHDSEEMRALMSYLTYISKGIEQGAEIPWRMLNTMNEIPEPSVDRGEELYAEKNCLACHATDGAGTGANTGPALWGDNSFNDGAGMSRMTKMAGYIKNNMPIGAEYELTDQEASDLAAFILSRERPEWEGHETDFPGIKKPTDIIDKERREAIRAGTFDWTEIENVIPAENE
ncbi:c-type cytochrome [Virgibacillus sp. W0430]|uniref:c-type cytochrome n=1 Tax=Virgibacillus sp. W0430 TaxID=3391580 RepID=UPI003F44FF6C